MSYDGRQLVSWSTLKHIWDPFARVRVHRYPTLSLVKREAAYQQRYEAFVRQRQAMLAYVVKRDFELARKSREVRR